MIVSNVIFLNIIICSGLANQLQYWGKAVKGGAVFGGGGQLYNESSTALIVLRIGLELW